MTGGCEGGERIDATGPAHAVPDGSTPSMAPADEPHVYRSVLPNGLRLVVRERPDGDVLAISVGIRGGSRDEADATVGAAHFMEHMYFQGTPARPDAADIDRDIEATGGWTNAWTGWESVNFQVVVPGEAFDLALDVIADQMVNSLFAADKIDKEREVVLEELNARLNAPSTRAFDSFMVDVFGTHPARNLPIGNRDTIGHSTREVLVSFRDTFFVAPNMTVAVVGNVQHDAVYEQAARAFAGLRVAPVPMRAVATLPPPVIRTRQATSPAQQARIVLGGPTRGLDSPDRYVMHVVEALLGEAGRRLEREIVDRRALASSVGAFYLELTDIGIWGVAAGTRSADVDAVVDLVRAELQRLRDEPISQPDLSEAKAYIQGNRLLHRERSVDLAEELSDGDVLGYYEPLAAFLAHIQAVTPADVQRLARSFLDPDAFTLVVLRP
ncbi:MAG: insulinase family protein [Chloroflexi bacterium]|nr:insulinase family protein [Chloroflexota bacterium]